MVGGNDRSHFFTALYLTQSNLPHGAVQIHHLAPHLISFCLAAGSYAHS